MRSFALFFGVASLALAVGCSNSPGSEDGTDEGAVEQGPAGMPLAPGLAAFTFVTVDKSMPAETTDPSFPESTTCDTDAEYVQIAGTAVDAKINAVLKKAGEAPTRCETPESTDVNQSVKFASKEFVSIQETGSWYAVGAAHPSFGIGYKTFDLKTGDIVTLDKLVKPEAKDTILRSLRSQIGSQRVEVGPRRKDAPKLDPADKDALLQAAGYELNQPLKDVSFSISTNGIRVDVTNQLPHAVMAIGGDYLVRWKTLDKHLLPGVKERIKR